MLSDRERNAIKDYVQQLTVEAHNHNNYINFFENLGKLSQIILKNRRWKSIFRPAEFACMIGDVFITSTNRPPKDFVGSIGELGDAYLDTLIESISSAIASYPRHYYFYFNVPGFTPTGIQEISICPDISLVEIRMMTEQKSKNDKLIDDCIARQNRPLENKRGYIRVQADGYVGASFDSITASLVLSRFKCFLYLSKVCGVLKQRDFYHPHLPDSQIQVLPVVVQNVDSPENERYEIPLPPGIGQYVSTLELNADKLNIYEPSKTILAGPFRKPQGAEEMAHAIPAAFDNVANCLELFRGNPDCEPIKAAIEWFIDAETSYNDTISFLQSCIGLEAILGDTTTDRLIDKLSDRYAYLHGKTATHRIELRKKFKRIYEYRSKIVHGRSASLSDTDSHRDKPKQMLDECICEELNNVLKAVRSKQKS